MSEPIDPQLSEALSQKLKAQLFQNPLLQAYAILDGASNPALLDYLYGNPRPEFFCLYRGELEPDIAECAPYVVELAPESNFTAWVTTHCWGNHWGVFAIAPCDLREMRQHLRKLTMVYDPEALESLYFRFYDPRVLADFLKIAELDQVQEFFGPILTLFGEVEAGAALARYQRLVEGVQIDVI